MKDTLTAEKLEEIEARANTATPGPWEQTDGNIWIDTRECVCCGRGSIHGCCGEPDVVGGQELIGTSNPVDAEFMAHARTDIPALLAHAKAQAAEIERLTGANSVRPDYPLYCDDCGRAHILDTVLPSEIWNQIAEPSNLLCAVCIDRRLEEKGMTAQAQFFYVGTALSSELYAEHLSARATAAEARVAELEKLLNTPEVFYFVKAVQLEAAHQRARWGSDHDAGKTDADWFWLVGYLAGKALHNPPNDMPPAEAQLHRIVAAAAALANWHAAKLGLTNMRPGIEPPLDAALGAKP